MQKEIESKRPSSLQEGLNAITQALRAAAMGINARTLIEKISAESGLSSSSQFTREIISKRKN